MAEDTGRISAGRISAGRISAGRITIRRVTAWISAVRGAGGAGRPGRMFLNRKFLSIRGLSV